MEIKQMPVESFDQMTSIVQAAYPGSFKGTSKEKKRVSAVFKKLCEKESVTALGAFEGDVLIGSVFHYEFETNFHGNMIFSAGIGSLAVDLLHKKKHVAQKLIQTSLDLAKEKGIALYTLYPFSAEFYRNFGFGYGVAMDTYKVKPFDFVDVGDRSILSYATEDDHDVMDDFYDEQVLKTHGMSKKTYADKRRLKAMKTGKVIIAKHKDQLIGYLVIEQKPLKSEDTQSQKIVVSEMIYSDRKALMAFVSFFAAQKDQVSYVEVATFDQHFNQVLKTTTYTPKPETLNIISLKVADKAYGLMSYALNPSDLLKKIQTRTCKSIEFTIVYPSQTSEVVKLNDGDELIKITLSINSFSSWINGCIGLNDLYYHQQLETTHPEQLNLLDQTFYFDQPKSYTRF